MGIRDQLTTNHVFDPVYVRRSADYAVDAIAKAIFFCHVKIGEKLPSEKTLTAQLGLNRTALREALKRMEKDGILEVRAGAAGGAFVVGRPPASYVQMFLPTQVEVEDFAEILITRRAIEPQIVELAASRASPQELQEMRDILAPLEELRGRDHYTEEDIETFSMAALRFNTALGRATHMRILETIMQVLTQQIEPIRRRAAAKVPAAAIDTLLATLDAICLGDSEKIASVLATRFNYLEQAWQEETGRQIWREPPRFLATGTNT
ncbi:FCD domain-containing protein [Roseicyclus sp. F158]|uniref:FCD domain-containing protein n=1 Tax=Tropicimonas omnivorans TaxID=3075590 RepID=A0ABU3DEN6_9RHOB|nr:FCD domain-containing protein [Roseicyclus sp. F158]MDT0682018.1 FCD domain-containing protein [Roseicyclus sp. F158]